MTIRFLHGQGTAGGVVVVFFCFGFWFVFGLFVCLPLSCLLVCQTKLLHKYNLQFSSLEGSITLTINIDKIIDWERQNVL